MSVGGPAQQVADAFRQACLGELEALKPGNVHIFADGHGMRVEDFLRSAEAAAGVIATPDSSVGQRILAAVDATWDAVGCNTNLGILLLCAPLVQAALLAEGATLQARLRQVLHTLDIDDARLTFQAIVRASPAGLGDSKQHDVNTPPGVTLLEAMRSAAERDRIAWQYAHDFADVFERGVACYRDHLARWGRPAWAATAVYLEFLADIPDTHVVRKHGQAIAEQVRQGAAIHRDALRQLENPKLYQRELLDYDALLKSQGINPGTSADLTVAALLAALLEDGLAGVRHEAFRWRRGGRDQAVI